MRSGVGLEARDWPGGAPSMFRPARAWGFCERAFAVRTAIAGASACAFVPLENERRDGFRRLCCGADYGTTRVATCGGAHAMRLRCCEGRGRMRNRSQAADAAGSACERCEHQQEDQCECEMYAARHRCFSVARGLFASEANLPRDGNVTGSVRQVAVVVEELRDGEEE